jgi:hypothetical protein
MPHVEVDVWVRGSQHAATHRITSVPVDATAWTDADVRQLLLEMLLALDREKNPGGERPPVTLRGFSWVVSPYDSGGVVLHLEMQLGTASAGPFALDEEQLTAMVTRVMRAAEPAARLH